MQPGATRPLWPFHRQGPVAERQVHYHMPKKCILMLPPSITLPNRIACFCFVPTTRLGSLAVLCQLLFSALFTASPDSPGKLVRLGGVFVG